MNNAFGAEVEVTLMETWSIRLGRDDEGSLGVFRKVEPVSSLPSYESLTWSTKLDPVKAKALVAQLTVQIEGVVQRNADKQTVLCFDDHSSAKIDSPTEWDHHKCVVQVHFSRIAFVTKNGKVIKEWRDTPEKATLTKTEPQLEPEAPLDELGADDGPYVDADGNPINVGENASDLPDE